MIRHGTRYPTVKHLSLWKALQRSLPSKLPENSSNHTNDDWSRTARALRQWTNPICQAVDEGKASASELAARGMREQYCLGRRLRKRFPGIPEKYSPLAYDFRSTEKSRTLRR